jgi:two-component system phosphate regulon response regulator PhoB
MVIASMLESLGHRVLAAENAARAHALLDQLRATPELPDAILLDMRLPGMSGEQFARRLAKDATLGGIPILLLTGGLGELPADAPANLRGVIRKPFSPRLLAVQLDRIALGASPPSANFGQNMEEAA